jgi:hypothetical protein
VNLLVGLRTVFCEKFEAGEVERPKRLDDRLTPAICRCGACLRYHNFASAPTQLLTIVKKINGAT